MSLLERIDHNIDMGNAAARICAEALLKGDIQEAVDYALMAQRHDCEADEYRETLRIASEATR